MILSAQDRVLVWGITGRQASFWTAHMIACGTRVAGGVNPARAGSQHLDRPVVASGREIGFEVALLFVPPAAVLGAATDAIEAGARLVIILAEYVPLHDVLAVHALARRGGTRVIGPNTAGLVTPGAAFAGIMPAFNHRVFQPGVVGVVSRSGSLGTLICLELVRAGLGQSAFIGIGGDPVPGTSFREALEALEADARTGAAVLVGEIGGALEQEAAAFARTMTKPVVAFIAGASAPPGRRMGHAGAIITGDGAGHAAKRAALEQAGVSVVSTPGGIPGAVLDALRRNRS
jgi:succinyl-CoA synthetase alpha subunit